MAVVNNVKMTGLVIGINNYEPDEFDGCSKCGEYGGLTDGSRSKNDGFCGCGQCGENDGLVTVVNLIKMTVVVVVLNVMKMTVVVVTVNENDITCG